MTLEPKAGWAYVGCPHCGMVTTVLLNRTEPTPWCVHHDTTISWRDPYPRPPDADMPGWTRMVRVTVNEAVKP